MKTMRRLGAAALALTMTVSGFAFTACGSDRDENTLWIGYEKQGYGSDWLNASIAAFKEENPEVKIELHEESPGYGNLVQQELQNGTPTNDLIICSAINWAPFAASGKLADLATVYASSYGNAFGDTIESAMIDGAKNTCKGSDGNYYTLRMEEAMASFVYNKTVSDYYEGLKSAWGTTVKIAKVKTVNDLMKWVNKIMELSSGDYPFTYLDTKGTANEEKGAVAGFTFPGKYMNYWDSIVSTWWAQYSGFEKYSSFFEMESAEVYSDVGRREALEAFEKLDLNRTMLTGSIELDHTNSQNAIVSGRALLIPNGVWMSNESASTIKSWGATLEMIPVPFIDSSHDDENYAYCQGGAQAMIPTGEGKNVDLAKKFLAFLNTETEVLRFTRTTNGMRPFNDGYAQSLIDGLELDYFAQTCFAVHENAAEKIYDTPNDLSAPNYKMCLEGVAKKWALGNKYTDLIQEKTDAKTVFDDEVSYATEKFDSWLRQVGLL